MAGGNSRKKAEGNPRRKKAGGNSRKKARIETEAVRIPEDVAVGILKMLPVKSLHSRRKKAGGNSRKKARIETEAVRIPEDVAVGILKMLPVKSLLRFSCACKTWYSVISDPEFCNKLHQRRDACVLIYSRPKRFSTVTIENLSLSTTLPLPLQPESEDWSRIKFLGSCNGLVCVAYESPAMSGLILWNPSTRKYRKLPPTSKVRNWFDKGTYAGFGYDELVDDYKFVGMVWKGYSAKRRIEFHVFSLKSNTWRTFNRSDITLSPMYTGSKPGVLFHGAIHWIVYYEDPSSKRRRIFAFDLASETYRLLELPTKRWWDIKIVSLSGCLCLYRPRDSSIYLWMIKEYNCGQNSSWIKLRRRRKEGSIVAMVEYLPSLEGCEIMRLEVKNGAIVSYEPVLSVTRDTIVSEETLVSLN